MSPEPETVTGFALPLQTRSNASAAGVTASEKVTVRFASVATPLAPSAGVVPVTDGASSPLA